MRELAFTDQDLERIGALLDRLDPVVDAECDVAGCIHRTHHESLAGTGGGGTV